MNTIKSAIVIATLLGIGYGVHVVLNKPIPNGNMETTAELDDWGLPRIEQPNPQNSVGIPPDSDPKAANRFNGPVDTFNNPSAAANTEGLSVQTAALDRQADAQTGPILGAPNSTIAPPTLRPPDNGLEAPSQAGQTNSQSTVTTANNLAPVPPSNSLVAGNDFPQPSDDFPRSTGTSQLTLPEMDPNSNPPVGPSTQTSRLDALPDYPSTDNITAPPLPNQGLSDSTQPLGQAENDQAFRQIWTSAQTKLQNGQYAEALFVLSLWYSDPNLTAPQREQLIPLLDQLAGTVIYSEAHHLEPPYVVEPGETLEQVATKYSISTAFLTRANSLTGPLTSGQQLKVVRGPFRAELNRTSREITLFLGRFYAGRFSAGVGRDLPAGDLSLEVVEFAGVRPYYDPRTSQPISPGDPRNPYGEHWIGLQVPGMPRNPVIGLHSHGPQIDASDTRGCISLDAQDAEDLQSILTIGSRFTIIR